jgi:hypothetical protein
MRMFIGGLGQLPEVKPSVTKLADLSVADPTVVLKLLVLRHISPNDVRYEMVRVPQKNPALSFSLVSSVPLTVPMARCPSTANPPDIICVKP